MTVTNKKIVDIVEAKTKVITPALKATTGASADYLLKMDGNGDLTAFAGAKGVQISSSSSTFSTTSLSPTDVTNLSVTITTTGRPVLLMLQPDGTSNGANIGTEHNGNDYQMGMYLLFVRDSTTIAKQVMTFIDPNSVDYIDEHLAFTGISHIDIVSAGTYTYKVQINVAFATETARCHYCKLVALEL